MKKYKKVISIGVVILIVVTSFLLGRASNTESEFVEDKPKQIKQENLLSYYIENENGEYEAASGETWPTEGYKFNATLSKCENGGELGWDETKGVITMTGNMSDKCYIYFDIVLPKVVSDVCSNGEKLAACITILADKGGSSNTSIYHHDGNLKNGIDDGSYRYAGASDVVNNYVCFGSDEETCPTDNLYRIIGVFGDQVKLIKSDYVNSNLLGTDGDYYGSTTPNSSYYKGSMSSVNTYYWNYKATGSETNTWSTSLLNKTNLNTNFITYLNNINAKWANMIAETTWKVGGNTWDNIADVVAKTAYQNEIKSPVTTNSTDNATEYKAKIGLMYVSDYGYAASPSAWSTILESYNSSSVTSVNWMYMGLYEWTISRWADDSNIAFRVEGDGHVHFSYVHYSNAVRPVFYLVSTATYASGKGTSTSPYRIN